VRSDSAPTDSFSPVSIFEDRLFVILFVCFSLAQLAVIAWSPLDLSGDELHYALWAKNLDYCYYSKGPLVALLIAASTAVFGETAFAIRLPAALCYGLFTLIFYAFARRNYSARLALYTWLALRSSLAFAQSGFVMTTDAPLVLLWMLALWAGYKAVVEQRHFFWVHFGFAAGLAVWSKYTALFLLPSLALAVLLCGGVRENIKRVGPYLGLLVFALMLSPILYWNSQNEWVNFAHNAGHLVKESGVALRPKYFFELLLGQVGLLGPLLFCGFALALVVALKQSAALSPKAKYFLSLTLPLAVFVLIVSLTKRVYANWPLPLYIGGLLLLLDLIANKNQALEKRRAWFKPAIVLNLVLLLLVHFPLNGITLGIPGDILPTKKLTAWSELGEAVKKIRSREQAESSEKEILIITDRYWTASAIPFYAGAGQRVLLSNLSDRRMTQFDIWQDESDWRSALGSDAILILNSPDRLEAIKGHFRIVTPDPDLPVLHVEYSGTVVRSFYFYQARGYDAWIPPPARG